VAVARHRLPHDPLTVVGPLPVEIRPRLVPVVAPAPELDVLDGGLAADGVRTDVVELDECTLVAPAAVGPHERAAAEVAHPDRALDLGRDVTRTRRRSAGRLGVLHSGELAPGEIREQGREGSVEDGGVVTGGDRVPQHVLGEAQLLERGAVDRALQLVAIGRERGDLAGRLAVEVRRGVGRRGRSRDGRAPRRGSCCRRSRGGMSR
jgi:hypothetical protein